MTAEVADRTAAAAPPRGDAQNRRVTHAIAQASIIAVEMLRGVDFVRHTWVAGQPESIDDDFDPSGGII
jgi:hypothetical protein